MKSAEIRDAFLKYFESQGHAIVPSHSLIPDNDPTLLFTNAGMVPFKDVFLGEEKRNYVRATSSQRCVRAGGKHNDLENVGYTARHHTFFEMLGNFSFGDYFKHDAIKYAWEFLTGSDYLNIPTEKLTVTVYADDNEAYDIWHDKIGVPAERLIRIGDNKGGKYQSDNFWSMGETGPCGPCTEIFYDHGADIWGGLPGTPEEDGDRYIEIWNNVFMQFNRTADGTMHPLPKPSVDTGMGLERIAAVMQGVHNNYDIDLFRNLIAAAGNLTGEKNLQNQALRVIADHIRSAAFLIADGVLPSNEGRGYVLRRIIRRALRQGHKLGQNKPFFFRLVAALAKEMGDAYPELVQKQAQIEKVLNAEEEQFSKTLANGMVVLEETLTHLQGSVIAGEIVFKLYDTYGFPTDLTNDIARERNLTIDLDGYKQCMEAQKARARAGSKFGVDYSTSLDLQGNTEFTGYIDLDTQAQVVNIFVDGEAVRELSPDQKGVVVLDHTSFYAESGGQVGDSGFLIGAESRFEVNVCTKQGGSHLHTGTLLQGSLKVGDTVTAQVDVNVRNASALNHSATHLLHAALRRILGDHVAQQGSLVDSERLRFDFSHFEAMRPEQIKHVEQMVNDQIRGNSEVRTEVMSMDAAKQSGAMALFGEKYGDEVRVLSMGGYGSESFSIELCGGTHARRTGDIGLVRITSESGTAAGVRRLEAVTGAHALALFDEAEAKIARIAASVKAKVPNLEAKILQFVERQRQMTKELESMKTKLASSAGADLLSESININGSQVLIKHLDGVDGKSLRDLMDQLKSKVDKGVIMLAAVNGDKITLVAGVTKSMTSQIKAGDMIQFLAPLVGGKGGGRPDMAQGGGTNPAALPAGLESLAVWINEKLNS